MPIWFWIAETVMLLIAACLFSLPAINAWRERKQLAAVEPSSAALAIAKLLEHDAGGWVIDRHVWSHPRSGLNIWVANKDYGLHWWMGRPDAFSGRIDPPKIDKEVVWAAIEPIMAGVSNDMAVKVLEALRTAATDGVAANVVTLKR